HECVPIAARIVNVLVPATGAGVLRSVVELSPSAPPVLSPQQYADVADSAHVWRPPAVTPMKCGGVEVALNVSGLPATPGELACSVFVPDRLPSVHAPAEANPSALVGWMWRVTVPPPAITSKVITT